MGRTHARSHATSASAAPPPTRRTKAHACAQRHVKSAGAHPRASAQLSRRHVARCSTAWNWSFTRRARYYVRCLLSREAEELAANAAAEAAAASTSAESQRWKMMQAPQPSVADHAAAAAASPSACPRPCLLRPPRFRPSLVPFPWAASLSARACAAAAEDARAFCREPQAPNSAAHQPAREYLDRLLPIVAAALAPDQELHSMADTRAPPAQQRPQRSAQAQCHGRVRRRRREVWRGGSAEPPAAVRAAERLMRLLVCSTRRASRTTTCAGATCRSSAPRRRSFARGCTDRPTHRLALHVAHTALAQKPPSRNSGNRAGERQ